MQTFINLHINKSSLFVIIMKNLRFHFSFLIYSNLAINIAVFSEWNTLPDNQKVREEYTFLRVLPLTNRLCYEPPSSSDYLFGEGAPK